MEKSPASWRRDLGRIGLMWGIAVAIATLWTVLDQRVPAWDQAEHLSLSMNHWWWLSHTSPWTAAAGRSLWMLSPKYPPVFYLVTAIGHWVLGPGPDRAMVANAGFALILLIATYGLGRHLFSPRVGLMAAGLTLLMPRLLRIGLDYQLDYAVTALVILSFWCLTVWQDARKGRRQWLWIMGFGLSFGLALMTKQSAALFLFVPLAWVSVTGLFCRRWGRLLQLLGGAVATVAVMLPWLSVNWVFQFSIFGNTNLQSAQSEGDPMLNTLAAWTYYWQDLPAAVSWPLLIVPLVGVGLQIAGLLPGRHRSVTPEGTAARHWWLLAYLLGAYLLWSAVVNKDPRYIAPYLPALAVFLAWGLECWWRRWPGVVIATLSLSGLVTLLNLFPVGLVPTAWLASTLAPHGQLYPYQGQPYPHPELIDHIAQAQPYQIATVGGLQSTAAVNQHNVSYYGKLQDYRVYGRQVGDRSSMLEKDMGSLSWFYGQGSKQEPWPPTAENTSAELARQLSQRPDFDLDRAWELPDDRRLYLYRRQQFPVTVVRLLDTACPSDGLPRLSRIEIPSQAAAGQTIPVTYEWIGPWETLSQGTVLLTWEPTAEEGAPAGRPWIHDHGIGLGTLRPQPFQTNQTVLAPAAIDVDGCFQVTERTATQSPENAPLGSYRLMGRYFQGTAPPQPLKSPAVEVSLTPTAAATAAPELDWVTQLRQAGRFLAQGPDLLDEVFDPIGRINLYDPVQNYTVQAEKTLRHRWQESPEQTAYGYGLVLAQILQLKVDAAIASLETLVERDQDNPYARAYLGFVNLYAFRPRAADAALAPAVEMAPDSPEIHGLRALAALFQGNVWGAWQRGSTAIALASGGKGNGSRSPF